MKTQQLSVLHSVAEHYHHDAIDFADRFDILWENQIHKTGHIKTFVDLLMACECELKAHVTLRHLKDDAVETYKRVRRAGHRIGLLVEMAHFMEDRATTNPETVTDIQRATFATAQPASGKKGRSER